MVEETVGEVGECTTARAYLTQQSLIPTFQSVQFNNPRNRWIVATRP